MGTCYLSLLSKSEDKKKKEEKTAAELSTLARANIPKKEFAIPSKAEGKEEKKESGNYPIPDAAHARNALARVSQHGSPSEKAQVRAKVHKQFPEIGKEKESSMNPRLQAGIELVFEKMAAEQAAGSPLTQALNRTLQKISEEQGVEQEKAPGQGSSPADQGMETRNKSFGKGTTDTDYDKKTGGEGTGKVTNLNGKGNVTSEAAGVGEKKAMAEGGGTEKKASVNAKIMRTMLSGLV